MVLQEQLFAAQSAISAGKFDIVTPPSVQGMKLDGQVFSTRLVVQEFRRHLIENVFVL
jgi:hypothetical protein